MFLPGEDQPRVTLGHVGVVPVRIELTFLFVPLYYMGSLTTGTTLEGLAMTLMSIAGIFLSILFHEIGHGAVARHYGQRVDELVVGGFYGYARIIGIAPSRRAAVMVLVAGPLANLALFFWLWLLLGMPQVSWLGSVGYDETGGTSI